MINVTKSYLPDRSKFNKYVDQIFDSHYLTNFGPLQTQLENRLKEYFEIDHMVLMSNGTLPLQVAYHLFDLKGEVLTTPFSFVATTSSLMWEKLCPTFVDIDSNTYCIDSNKIEEKINEFTSAIVPVHVYGNICNVEEIEKIANTYNLKVIYDAAHAFGVKYKSKSILKWGDASTLSFHATKLFHTIEGGALILHSKEAEEEARSMINFGYKNWQVKNVGINAKMNEFSAAMGLAILDDIDIIYESRSEIFNYYTSELKNYAELLTINDELEFNYSYYPILFKNEETVLKIIKELNKIGVNPRRYFFPSLDTLTYIDKTSCPLSNDVAKRVLCLPMYPGLEREDQTRIVSVIKEHS